MAKVRMAAAAGVLALSLAWIYHPRASASVDTMTLIRSGLPSASTSADEWRIDYRAGRYTRRAPDGSVEEYRVVRPDERVDAILRASRAVEVEPGLVRGGSWTVRLVSLPHRAVQ